MFDVISEIKRDYVTRILEEGRRVDGRGFDDYRDIKVEIGVYSKAEGSSLVSIGKTRVVVGVKMVLGEPFPDIPNSGVLTTNAELVPLASPTFEAGPPRENTIELARVVDRGIRESGAIDVDKLCVVEGELVWVVFVDAHILDYDGNLFDATSLSAITALLDTQIPKIEEDKVIYEEKTGPLPIVERPISTTFAKVKDTIFVDPSLDEEQVMDARLTISTTENGDICAMQKGGSGTFSSEEISDTIERGRKKAKELRKFLKGD
ncbi:MAG: exosome complex protein Rrp42 [Candidatus Hydrothermarchaeales archaeon]